jgi:hypothetical protein
VRAISREIRAEIYDAVRLKGVAGLSRNDGYVGRDTDLDAHARCRLQKSAYPALVGRSGSNLPFTGRPLDGLRKGNARLSQFRHRLDGNSDQDRHAIGAELDGYQMLQRLERDIAV